MKRIIKYLIKVFFGAAAGFAVWMLMSVSIDRLLDFVMPAWFIAERAAIDRALDTTSDPFSPTVLFLSVSLLINAVAVIAAGYISVVLSKKRIVPPYLVGSSIAILIFVLSFHTPLALPWWYRILAAGTVIPMALLGAKLSKR
ncbi:MAG: hypothetical protein HKN25_12170 [Pyrinomonadaceae bacterium]|nr:hypothetical protein [Pyrinomonadaceae bacterium]